MFMTECAIIASFHSGRISAMDTSAAEALPGAAKVYTCRNTPARKKFGYFQKGGYVSDSTMPLTGPVIHRDGQSVAMVLTEAPATARDGARWIVVSFDL